VESLEATLLHHLDREFSNLVAPEWHVARALLQRMKADAANDRASGQIDTKRELPDERVVF
jgi:hypothetical protein